VNPVALLYARNKQDKPVFLGNAVALLADSLDAYFELVSDFHRSSARAAVIPAAIPAAAIATAIAAVTVSSTSTISVHLLSSPAYFNWFLQRTNSLQYTPRACADF
jgi:hypothetical protein